MSLINDVKSTKDRFSVYIDQLTELLKQYNITGQDWYENLKRANKDKVFVARRDEIWSRILEREGGKLTFGMVLAIIGAILGSIGVAGLGGAIGIPLILLLAPTGVCIGNEIDEKGWTKDFVEFVKSWPRIIWK